MHRTLLLTANILFAGSAALADVAIRTSASKSWTDASGWLDESGAALGSYPNATTWTAYFTNAPASLL